MIRHGIARWLNATTGIDFGRYGREAALSMAAFLLLLLSNTPQGAIILASVILWHEYGHLVAYKLTGRHGNRMMLIPFLGGVAVASAPHKNEYERAFSALGGPGISVAITIPLMLLRFIDLGPTGNSWIGVALFYASVLNLLNMVPIYMLDGGHVTDAFLRTYLFKYRKLLMRLATIFGLVVVLLFGQPSTFIILCILALVSLSNYSAAAMLPTMSRIQSTRIFLGTAAILLVHGLGYYIWLKFPQPYY